MDMILESKLWVPLAQAARYLSTVLKEDVSEADVLHLGLRRKLQLSIFLINGASARHCELLSKPVPPFGPGQSQFFSRTDIGDKVLETDLCSRHWLKGIYDLPMIGGEQDTVFNKHQNLIGETLAKVNPERGAIVNLKNDYFELVKLPDGFNPDDDDDCKIFDSAPLPEDSLIVIRTSALKGFEQSFTGNRKQELPPSEVTPQATKSTRRDALSVEIDQIIEAGTPSNVEAVWKALMERFGKIGGCIRDIEETDDGPIIHYRTRNGMVSPLNKKALAGRLQRRKPR